MIEILIIVGSIMIITGVICLLADENGLAFILGLIGAYLLSGGIMLYGQRDKPTAMDVYQGKTTLKVSYKDGILVDSVVVFKNAEK
jgi:hypothetical protein